ncbi:hypothetical protein CBR_g26403 [Chara braunii]|uniref:Uncharacterized protein n=1 Tax=Chara braunii TaxID=69332 RepID=A0A388L7Y3_CHABU|nr:hypothetical protein CBR_g26403 [Chara braunii]|eukprot:GBG78374.1 hypothetical protein CBR_g26403 [Chara braunii]
MHTVRKDATQNDEAVPRLESSAIDKIGGDCEVRVSTTSQHMITGEQNKAKTNLDRVETNEQLTLPASNLPGGSADIAVDDKSTVENMEILSEHEGKTSGGSNPERPQECEGHMITEERNEAKTNLNGVKTNEQPMLMVECELRMRIEVDHGETDCARLALQPASNLPGGSTDIVVEDKTTVEKMEILPEHEGKISGGSNPERPQEFEEYEDEQLEQKEANTKKDDSEDENNRDNDDFGERESNEDEDDDNEYVREQDDENDAHFTNEKAIVMRGRKKRDASKKSKPNNCISDNIHTLYAHSKIVKQLMRCVAKGFYLSRAKDAEMYPLVDTYLESFRVLIESLNPDTRFIVDQSMKSTTPTRELTNIRGEIAYDIVRAFRSVAGLPYPCGTIRDRFEKEREEMRTKMLEQSSWRVKGEEPWGATEFKNVVRDVLYIDWNEAGRNGCSLQQLAFAHMVLECHIINKSRPARTAAASKEMQRI